MVADGAGNQSVDIGIQCCGNDTRGEMEIRRAIPRSHETWNNYYSFSFLTPLSSRMNGQQQWTWVAVMALLVLTAMAGEGGKAEKQGEASKILL